MDKVYALTRIKEKGRYELKISCEKQWQNQYEKVLNCPSQIYRLNECILLSLSRKELVKIAEQTKIQWLNEACEEIKNISLLNIK